MTEEQERDRRLRDVTVELNGFKEEQLTLKGFEPIKAFVLREIGFWNEFENPSSFAGEHRTHYENIRNQLDQIEIQNQNWDDEQFNPNWDNVAAQLRQESIAQGPMIVSSSPLAEFLREQWNENPELSVAAHLLLTKYTQSVSLHSVNAVIGFLRAHEFENADLPSTKRSRVERRTLGRLRSDWQQATQDLHEEFQKRKTELEDWKDAYIQTHEDWRTEKTDELTGFLVQKRKELENLENTYRDSLRFEGPADHWATAATKYKKQGILWCAILSVVVLVTVGLLLLLLYVPPAIFSTKLFDGDPLAIRAVIIFGAVLSFLAYLVKIFGKLTLSSFHLFRDAEEREQLMTVYLSLTKEQGDTRPEERELILQSLFARTDTGLLGKDSEPAMPGASSILPKSGK